MELGQRKWMKVCLFNDNPDKWERWESKRNKISNTVRLPKAKIKILENSIEIPLFVSSLFQCSLGIVTTNWVHHIVGIVPVNRLMNISKETFYHI